MAVQKVLKGHGAEPLRTVYSHLSGGRPSEIDRLLQLYLRHGRGHGTRTRAAAAPVEPGYRRRFCIGDPQPAQDAWGGVAVGSEHDETHVAAHRIQGFG